MSLKIIERTIDRIHLAWLFINKVVVVFLPLLASKNSVRLVLFHIFAKV